MADHGANNRPRRALPPTDADDQIEVRAGEQPPARARRSAAAPDESSAVSTTPPADHSDAETDAEQTSERPAITDEPTATSVEDPRAGRGREALGRWRDQLTRRTNASSVQQVDAPAREVEVIPSAATTAATAPGPTATTTEATSPAATPEAAAAKPMARPLTRRQRPGTTSGAGAATAATGTSPTAGEPAPGRSTPASPLARSEGSAASPPRMWEPRKSNLDPRTRSALLIAGVAAALVAVLAIGYSLWALGTNKPEAGASPVQSAEPTRPAPADPLADADLLTDTEANVIAPKAGWKVALTQDGTNAESPQPLCITQNIEGTPTPLMTKLRTLTTASTAKTQALHQADAYSTADEAKQVFDARLTQLGTCADTPAYLLDGLTLTGIGNQAGGVVAVIQNDSLEYHTIVLTRTGKVVNIIDSYQEGKPVNGRGVATAAASVIDDQCTQAVGLCTFSPRTTSSVPPPGGDQAGFLTNTDIPRINDGSGEWGGTNPATQVNVVGSQCESVDFNTLDGPTARKARTYLLRNDDQAPQNFGIDQVILTMNDAKAADALVAKISKSITDCQKRALTAKVVPGAKIDGMGARNTPVKGQTFQVSQKTDTGGVSFRVGIVSAGNKVVYTVAPGVDKAFNFADGEWNAVALRAGQRVTQVR